MTEEKRQVTSFVCPPIQSRMLMPTARNPHSRPMQAGQISNHKYNNSAIKYAVLVAFVSVHFSPNALTKTVDMQSKTIESPDKYEAILRCYSSTNSKVPTLNGEPYPLIPLKSTDLNQRRPV